MNLQLTTYLYLIAQITSPETETESARSAKTSSARQPRDPRVRLYQNKNFHRPLLVRSFTYKEHTENAKCSTDSAPPKDLTIPSYRSSHLLFMINTQCCKHFTPPHLNAILPSGTTSPPLHKEAYLSLPAPSSPHTPLYYRISHASTLTMQHHPVPHTLWRLLAVTWIQ